MAKSKNLNLEKYVKNDPHGDTKLLQVNPREADFVSHLLKLMGGAGVINPKTGVPQFYDSGKGPSGDAGGGGSASGSGNAGTGGGNGGSTGGGNDGRGPGGTGTTTSKGSFHSSPEGGGGSVTGTGNPANGTRGSTGPAADDPRSFVSLLHEFVHPTPQPLTPQGAFFQGIGMLSHPVIGLGMKLGTAFGVQNDKVMQGIRDGSIPGSIGTDVNGTQVGFSGGAQYGGTTSTRGDLGGGTPDHSGGNQPQIGNISHAAAPAGTPGPTQQDQVAQLMQQYVAPRSLGQQIPGLLDYTTQQPGYTYPWYWK